MNDFDGDAKGDVLWRNQNGSMVLWQMNGTAILSQNTFATIDSNWTLAASLATGTNPEPQNNN